MAVLGQEVTVSAPTEEMSLYTSAAVQSDTDIVLYTTHVDTCQVVSIALGHERLILEFYDVESLERLRDVASEGAARLRAAIEAA
jgi:hypothetical protein